MMKRVGDLRIETCIKRDRDPDGKRCSAEKRSFIYEHAQDAELDI